MLVCLYSFVAGCFTAEHEDYSLSMLTLVDVFCTSVFSTVLPVVVDRLVGLVVKASASRAEDPGFESRDIFDVESYR